MESEIHTVGTTSKPDRARLPKPRWTKRRFLVATLGLLLVVGLWPIGRRAYAVATLRAEGFEVLSRFPYPAWLRQRQGGGVTWLDQTGLFSSPCFISQQAGPGRPRLTTDAIRALGAFSRIEELNLVLSRATDEHLAELASLQQIRSIRLTGNPITDRGLQSLTGLRSLRVAELSETLVTDEGVAAFRRASPQCIVTYDDQDVAMPGFRSDGSIAD